MTTHGSVGPFDKPGPDLSPESQRAFEHWIASVSSLPGSDRTSEEADRDRKEQLDAGIAASAALIRPALPPGYVVRIQIRRRRGPQPELNRERTAAKKTATYDFFVKLLKHYKGHLPRGKPSLELIERAAQLVETILIHDVAQHGAVRGGGGIDLDQFTHAVSRKMRNGAIPLHDLLMVRSRMLKADSEGIGCADLPPLDRLRNMVTESWAKRSICRDHLAALLTTWFEGMSSKQTERVRSLKDDFTAHFKATENQPPPPLG